eukprot:1014787_1
MTLSKSRWSAGLNLPRDINAEIPAPTGDFQVDYDAVVGCLGLTVHPCLKATPPTVSESATENHVENQESSEQPDSPEIQPEQPDPPEIPPVTSVNINGFMLDSGTMLALSKVLPGTPSVSTVSLWNARLSSDVVGALSQTLGACPHIRTVCADWSFPEVTEDDGIEDNEQDNEDAPQPSYPSLTLLTPPGGGPSHLRALSLRGNSISDAHAAALFRALAENGNLVALNMSNNLLGGEACSAAFTMLRTNRALRALSLANNRISGSGCGQLTRALTPFVLSDGEKLAPPLSVDGVACCRGNDCLRVLNLSGNPIGDEAAWAVLAVFGEGPPETVSEREAEEETEQTEFDTLKAAQENPMKQFRKYSSSLLNSLRTSEIS